MRYRFLIFFLMSLFLNPVLTGQSQTYSVRKAALSSDRYDEFAPVYYKKGIVFCTDRNMGLVNYSDSKNKGPVKICYIDTTGTIRWQDSRLFSKNLTTKLNDGPVSFNNKGNVIFYSRNIYAGTNTSEISSPRNKLGIFTATADGTEWTRIRDLRINNEYYNVTTPCLSPDGKRLFFASDKPGGYGGFDLYYSQLKDDYWEDPVNLGPNVNSRGNEVYPFLNALGELFFSSDGHGGLGGKDIYVTYLADGHWIMPVHLDPPVNSSADDMGIVTDSLMNEGYFSTNRDKTYDIYHFKTLIPQIFYSSFQKENQYCFSFSDSGSVEPDTLNLRYIWDFGDGQKAFSRNSTHCYAGPGTYNVKLDIVERATGNLYFSKLSFLLDLKDIEQAYINSTNVVVKGDSIEFDGLRSYFPGYKILSYLWDFGDGTKKQGPKLKHAFKVKGEYVVNMALTIRADDGGKILKTGSSKRISVLDDVSQFKSVLSQNAKSPRSYPDVMKFNSGNIKILYSAESINNQDATYLVEIMSSAAKLDSTSNFFSKVPKKYHVEERRDAGGRYSYVVDQQMTLAATYISYREMINAGYNTTRVRIEPIQDPAAREVNNIKKIFGMSTDTYFDSYNRLTTSAYLLLDQIIKILNKYPEIMMEVAIYTDNTDAPETKLIQSQNYAQTITNYLATRGISAKRLIARGYGSERPIMPNLIEADRKQNRRIDFRVVRK